MSDKLIQTPSPATSDQILTKWITYSSPFLGIVSFAGMTYLFGWLKVFGYTFFLGADWAIYKLTTLDFLLWGAEVVLAIFGICSAYFMFLVSGKQGIVHSQDINLTLRKKRIQAFLMLFAMPFLLSIAFKLIGEKYRAIAFGLPLLLASMSFWGISELYSKLRLTQFKVRNSKEGNGSNEKFILIAGAAAFFVHFSMIAVSMGFAEAHSKYYFPSYVVTVDGRGDFYLMLSSNDRFLVAEIDDQKKSRAVYRWVSDEDVVSIRPNDLKVVQTD